ncbi:hypothetical protein ADL12_36515 [Streptomyces regalis]|uniref:Uncharacterized protein n=1 Tax=Streptomyces regalis TaxID=68262 RepID=A0A101JD89_9ACTN|nr:hypothetical protein ADL12_36515 [Streptomyces regalis]
MAIAMAIEANAISGPVPTARDRAEAGSTIPAVTLTRRLPVQAGREESDDQQIEGHLVRERPQDEQEMGCPQ